MRDRRVALLVLAVVLLAAMAAFLQVYRVTESKGSTLVLVLGPDSAGGVKLEPPSGAAPQSLQVVVQVQGGSEGPALVAVYDGETSIDTFEVRPGESARRSYEVGGPAKVIVAPGGDSVEVALHARLYYTVPALSTVYASMLAPVAVVSGFIAGSAVCSWARAKPKNLEDQASDIGGGVEGGEEAGGLHGQSS